MHQINHYTECGKKVSRDQVHFGKFCLQIFQAGPSWDIILKKRTFFRDAFSSLNIEIVANFSEI
ncbi:MAG: DNA-3-methyladenine glycosylase I [Bacteroidetes bacterium]|nr:DNA-3-methyladenine glycosylase I [Bacteroidota bacterium]